MQGNLIFPCGYTGGAKDRISAPCTFESNDVSLSSATGIAQVEKDKEFQLEQEALCLHLGNMLSDEAMDHVKKMCGPGYTLEGGKPVPIEPETEGSSKANGPGYFYQPHALTAGTGVEGFFGDDAKVPADDVAYLCKVLAAARTHALPPQRSVHARHSNAFAPGSPPALCGLKLALAIQVVEDDQAEIKTACIDYFLQFFKAMDEDGKGVLVGDAFKTVIGKLEEDMPMEAKEVRALAASACA